MRAVVLLVCCIFTGATAVRVLQSPPSLVLSVGDTAEMSCAVQGADSSWKLFYYWYLNNIRNSSKVRVPGHPSTLVISAVTPRDSGMYLCHVTFFSPIHNEAIGNGTQLLITVDPVVALRMEVIGAGRQLLLCEAQRFHPEELNISWSFSLRSLQTQENLTEHEDGTYTKISMVEITEELWDQESNHVTCYVQHITRTEKTLYHSGTRTSLYLYLFPVRVLLAVILILSPGICRLYLYFT